MVLFLIFPLVIAVISSYIHFCFWMEMFFRFFWHFLWEMGWFYHQRWRSKWFCRFRPSGFDIFLIRKADNQKLVNFDGHGRHWIHGADSSRPTVLYPSGELISRKVGIWQPKGTSFIVLLLIWIPLEINVILLRLVTVVIRATIIVSNDDNKSNM